MPRMGEKMLSKGKGVRGGNPGSQSTTMGSRQACASASTAFVLLCLAAPWELNLRIKKHLPTNNVVEAPCKLYCGSCPKLEARANQSKHVLGENRVQNQAGIRTAELMEAPAGAAAGQISDGDRSAITSGQLQKHSWKRLLNKGYNLSITKARCKAPLSVAGPGGTQTPWLQSHFWHWGLSELIFSKEKQPEFPCWPTLFNSVL